jgi:hypothetical protein
MDALLGLLLIGCGGFLVLAFIAWVFAAILNAVNRRGSAQPPPLSDAQRERLKTELMAEIRRQQNDRERYPEVRE